MYIRKEFKSHWLLGALKLSFISEDRENGEYKHMISLDFMKFHLLGIVVKTGAGNVSMGYTTRNSREVSFQVAGVGGKLKRSSDKFGCTTFEWTANGIATKQSLVVDAEALKKCAELQTLRDGEEISL